MRTDFWRFGGAGLMTLHGLIHLLGPLGALGLVDDPGIGLDPSVSASISWTVASLVLIAAGVALLQRREGWRWLALVGAVLSQMMIVTAWPEAAAGTAANAIVIGLVLGANRLGLAFAEAHHA